MSPFRVNLKTLREIRRTKTLTKYEKTLQNKLLDLKQRKNNDD